MGSKTAMIEPAATSLSKLSRESSPFFTAMNTLKKVVERAIVAIGNSKDLTLKEVVERAIAAIGNSKESLCASWIGYLCIHNAILHVLSTFAQMDEKRRFPVKHGKPKVASFGVMNAKYVGFFRFALAVHIIGGTLSVVGSAASIFFEERKQALSRRLAIIASVGQTFLHAPTAIAMSPIVYGDKGLTPFVYMVTSLLLALSGTAALFESTSSDQPGPRGMELRRPELRRMSTTVGIFLYVRLYALMRGVNGFLGSQKYALATVVAGLTMLPIGWDRCICPATFWALFFWNHKTVRQTQDLVKKYGIDGAAARQRPFPQAFPQLSK